MLLSTLALLSNPASACGGFACDAVPVLQAAERIIFGFDDEKGEVEMHVQITYTGAAEEFAWIVPVPNVPDILLDTSALFTQTALATLPTFSLQIEEEGRCTEAPRLGVSYDLAMASSADNSAPEYGGVTVVGQEKVGPYETVTLKADSTTALLGWLQDNAYQVPDSMEAVLAPYVSKDAYFVALRLAKGNDAGDLSPLALRYPAKRAIVPVQLTSISATDDMRMEAYVFSRGRAVPESYLHVTINEAAVDWWTAGSNYNDVITQAADEAGGHAFATDYHGPSDVVADFLPTPVDLGALRGASSAEEWISLLQGQLSVTSTELFEVLEDQLGLPDGAGQNYWFCPGCSDPATQFDADAATADLNERVIEPLQRAQDLLDGYPLLTRMTSSLDAAEMTVDPMFAVNHDMAQATVDNAHVAKLVYECGNGKRRNKAIRRLELADGRSIDIPSERWLEKHEMSEFEYISELGEIKAQTIEQMNASGQPEVVADFTDDLFDQTQLFNRAVGCGCDATGAGAGASLGLGGAALLIARRRRRG